MTPLTAPSPVPLPGNPLDVRVVEDARSLQAGTRVVMRHLAGGFDAPAWVPRAPATAMAIVT